MTNLSPYIIPILKPIPELIIDTVGLQTNEIKTPSRKREISDKRQLAMFLMRRKTTLTITQIGEKFNRDHTTVIHATKVINNRMSVEPNFNEKVRNLLKTIPDEIYSNREKNPC